MCQPVPQGRQHPRHRRRRHPAGFTPGCVLPRHAGQRQPLRRDDEPLRLRLRDAGQPRFQLRYALSGHLSGRPARPLRLRKRPLGRRRGALPLPYPCAGERAAHRHRGHRHRLCEHLGAAGTPVQYRHHRPHPRRRSGAGSLKRSGGRDAVHLPRWL